MEIGLGQYWIKNCLSFWLTHTSTARQKLWADSATLIWNQSTSMETPTSKGPRALVLNYRCICLTSYASQTLQMTNMKGSQIWSCGWLRSPFLRCFFLHFLRFYWRHNYWSDHFIGLKPHLADHCLSSSGNRSSKYSSWIKGTYHMVHIPLSQL